MEENRNNIGTTPLVLGIMSVIFSLTFSRLIGLILGIIAIVKGSKYRNVDNDAKAGWILGIIGVVLSGAIVFLVLLFFMLFTIPMAIPFFWF
ncbi:MAG: hypothetical protein K6G51_05370 [Sphaerochaetaceae bacterium]|nr:hypothetical protein [Sphaerochaetaceae bacterium]